MKLLALTLAALVYSGLPATAPAFAQKGGYSYSDLTQALVLPETTRATLTINNVSTITEANGTAKRCESTSGLIKVVRLDAPLDEAVEARDRDPGFVKGKAELLDLIEFELAAGESMPLQIYQPFPGLASIAVEIGVEPQFRRCLRASAATVQRADGDVLGIVPVRTAPSFAQSLAPPDTNTPTCCACAPVCGCGFCD